MLNIFDVFQSLRKRKYNSTLHVMQNYHLRLEKSSISCQNGSSRALLYVFHYKNCRKEKFYGINQHNSITQGFLIHQSGILVFIK